MKVFKFTSGDYYYAYSGNTEEEAREKLFDEVGEMDIDEVEEIQEERWDDRVIAIYEDNDMETEPFYTTIREVICDTPGMIFTNDLS